MDPAESRRPLAELDRLCTEIIEHRIQPSLGAEDNNKFVAVDVDTQDYEVDKDDYTAVMRLRGRRPTAEIWLGRIGQPTTYRMRRHQR